MKIIICGIGSLGSNLVRTLVPDLKGNHELSVLDCDLVEERNVVAGTQWYMPSQVGQLKVEALQFNVYQWFQREVKIIDTKLTQGNLEYGKMESGVNDLVVDCFDNWNARELVQSAWRMRDTRTSKFDLLHIGFSDKFTFEIEWAEEYKVPTDITSGIDICTLLGVASFVNSVASLGSLVINNYLETNKKVRVLGNKFSHREII